MQTIASLWAWFAVLCAIVVGFWVQLLLFLVSRPFDPLYRIPGRFFRLMAVATARLNPLWDFGYLGTPVPPTRPTVVISNHVSNADAFLISHLPWEMKWLGKASLFRVPFLGWMMWLANDVPVERGEKSSAASALLGCAQRVRKGMPVMIFPEGTRSKDGQLGPFKDGAFRLALETGADILPLAVAGTRDALPKHSWRFGRSRARVKVGAPIAAAGKTLEQLKAESREAVVRLTQELEAALAAQ